jgi:capsular polysaccharide biosynthesis protein
MLGIKSRRPPIEGDIADEIRDAVVRVAKGQLNEQEKASQERLKKALEKYEVKWEL